MTHRQELRKMIKEAENNLKRLTEIKPCFLKREKALCTAMEYYYRSIVASGNAWEEEIYGK